MKTKLSTTIRYFALGLLLIPTTAPLFCAKEEQAGKPKITLIYKSMTEFINDFFDVNKEKDKPLQWWAYQCIMLVLEDAKRDKNPDDFKKQQRQSFCNSIKGLAFGDPSLYNSEKERIAKVVKGIKDAFTDGYLYQIFPKNAADLIIAKFKTDKETALKAIEVRATHIELSSFKNSTNK